MVWDVGFDFCNGPTNVTHTPPFYAAVASVTTMPYPTTVATGIVAGWVPGTIINGVDRTTTAGGQDSRLCSVAYNFNTSTGPGIFQVDLPAAGDYLIGLAIGDQLDAQVLQWVDVTDAGAPILTFHAVATGSNQFRNAAGTLLSGAAWAAAAWPGTTGMVSCHFTTTTLTLLLGSADNATPFTTVAHLFISQVAAPTGPAATYIVFEG